MGSASSAIFRCFALDSGIWVGSGIWAWVESPLGVAAKQRWRPPDAISQGKGNGWYLYFVKKKVTILLLLLAMTFYASTSLWISPRIFQKLHV